MILVCIPCYNGANYLEAALESSRAIRCFRTRVRTHLPEAALPLRILGGAL